MSKTEATVLAATIDAEAKREIAFQKGRLAACHRRTVAGLMPKFPTDEEADSWMAGFQDTRRALEA